mgnify:CR=1 FL=1
MHVRIVSGSKTAPKTEPGIYKIIAKQTYTLALRRLNSADKPMNVTIDRITPADVAYKSTTAMTPELCFPERIESHKFTRGSIVYLVKWEGSDDSTWETIEHLRVDRMGNPKNGLSTLELGYMSKLPHETYIPLYIRLVND